MDLLLTWRMFRGSWGMLTAATLVRTHLRQPMGAVQLQNLQAPESIANVCSGLLRGAGRASDPELAARIAYA